MSWPNRWAADRALSIVDRNSPYVPHIVDALREAEQRGFERGVREAAQAVDRFAATGSCAHEVYGKHAALAVRTLLPPESVPQDRGAG